MMARKVLWSVAQTFILLVFFCATLVGGAYFGVWIYTVLFPSPIKFPAGHFEGNTDPAAVVLGGGIGAIIGALIGCVLIGNVARVLSKRLL